MKNILLIFTDQQRADTIEALGNDIIKTPAMNSLVNNGVSFTNAYTPSPVCISARCSLHSGLMPHETKCARNSPMPKGTTSFMELLSKNNYQTHGVGKMHFSFKDSDPTVLWGFTSRDISEEGGSNYDFRKSIIDAGYDHVLDSNGIRSEMYYVPQVSQLPDRLHNSTWVANRSVDFLNNRDEDKPFFLMSSFIKPHPPFEVPTPWNKLYRGPEMPYPKQAADNDDITCLWNQIQNRYKYMDNGMNYNLIRLIKAYYYAAISHVDFNIQKILDCLKDKDILKDTLIIFTSDHGEMLGDYNCVGKRCMLNSAVNVPMIMVNPDIKDSFVCNEPVSLIDVFPTIIDYANINEYNDASGVSLKDIACGDVKREFVCSQYHEKEYGLYMIATKEYKYIYSAPDDKEYLFDEINDKDELHNLARHEDYISIKEDIKNKLIDYYKTEGYFEPLDSNDFKKYSSKHMPKNKDRFLLFQDAPASLPSIRGYERVSKYIADNMNFNDMLESD